MPKIIKKRAVKKKESQEPEVKTAALDALDLLKKKQKQAITIVSVIAAVALLVMFFRYYSSSQNEKAYEFMTEAARYYYGESPFNNMPSTERWKKALELYKKSVEAKPTPAALFYLGNSHYNLGDYENAIKQYTLFADKFGGEYTLLNPVYQKLASAYFKTGKTDKALETLGKLAKVKNGIFKDAALFMEAKYFESIGDTAKAQERFKALAGEFPASPWTAEATAKVAQSGKKEVRATPEPTPPAEDASKK
ncbi:MAG: tetratricopeptide repeat protein [Nitrospirae bacterium]|nr:tetratricopeptide repeat protein [Nitrospirota bacterium]